VSGHWLRMDKQDVVGCLPCLHRAARALPPVFTTACGCADVTPSVPRLPTYTFTPSLPLPRSYVTADIAEAEGLHTKKLSGTKFRQMLRSGARGGGARGWNVPTGGARLNLWSAAWKVARGTTCLPLWPHCAYLPVCSLHIPRPKCVPHSSFHLHVCRGTDPGVVLLQLGDRRAA